MTGDGTWLNVFLIRHGMTAGNLEKRYIGRTDEPLCEAGRRALRGRILAGAYAPARQAAAQEGCLIYCSPMKRCLETAALIFPGREPLCRRALCECDFGRFEGRCWQELSGDSEYQAWIDSGGTAAFPGGELPEDFRRRCISAFKSAAVEMPGDARALIFVVHGGTIMSVLSGLAAPRRGYFDWQTDCGCGFCCKWDGARLRVTGKI